MFCLRTLRELKLLKFLSEAGVSENVCNTSSKWDPSDSGLTDLLNCSVDHFDPRHHQAPVA